MTEIIGDIKRSKSEEEKTLGKKALQNINTKSTPYEETSSEIPHNRFTRSDDDPKKIRFIGDLNKNGFKEPTWDPSQEFSAEIPAIPEDSLDSWQKQHVGGFFSGFDKRNKPRWMPQLNENELNRMESEIIHDYCPSLVKGMKSHFPFLESKFPNIFYGYRCGVLPGGIPGNPPPPIDQKVIVLVIANLKKIMTYPALLIVPTGYLMHSNDYELLKESLKKVSKRWSGYDEFYGIVTNFGMTVFLKYNRHEKQFYQWQHTVNFKECFLCKSLDKLKNFYKIWFALVYKAFQVFLKEMDSL